MKKAFLSTALLAGLAFGATPIAISANEPFFYDNSWVNRSRGNRSKTKCKRKASSVKREHKNRHKKGRP